MFVRAFNKETKYIKSVSKVSPPNYTTGRANESRMLLFI